MIYNGAMKVQEADNTQRPKGLCRALEGCLTGFWGGSEVATTGAVVGYTGANGRNTKNESALYVIRVYQNWLEFETYMRKEMVDNDTKLKILFTPGICWNCNNIRDMITLGNYS